MRIVDVAVVVVVVANNNCDARSLWGGPVDDAWGSIHRWPSIQVGRTFVFILVVTPYCWYLLCARNVAAVAVAAAAAAAVGKGTVEERRQAAGQQSGGSQGEEVGAMPPGRASLEVARIVRHPCSSTVLPLRFHRLFWGKQWIFLSLFLFLSLPSSFSFSLSFSLSLFTRHRSSAGRLTKREIYYVSNGAPTVRG